MSSPLPVPLKPEHLCSGCPPAPWSFPHLNFLFSNLRETDKSSHPLVRVPRCPQWLGLRAESGSRELSPGLPFEWQEPNHLSHHRGLPGSASGAGGGCGTRALVLDPTVNGKVDASSCPWGCRAALLCVWLGLIGFTRGHEVIGRSPGSP